MSIQFKNVDEFKKILMKEGYNHTSFAEVIEISQPFLSYIINGKRSPSPKVAKKMVETLGLKFDDIFYIE